jgi:hypothetical protein
MENQSSEDLGLKLMRLRKKISNMEKDSNCSEDELSLIRVEYAKCREVMEKKLGLSKDEEDENLIEEKLQILYEALERGDFAEIKRIFASSLIFELDSEHLFNFLSVLFMNETISFVKAEEANDAAQLCCRLLSNCSKEQVLNLLVNVPSLSEKSFLLQKPNSPLIPLYDELSQAEQQKDHALHFLWHKQNEPGFFHGSNLKKVLNDIKEVISKQMDENHSKNCLTNKLN